MKHLTKRILSCFSATVLMLTSIMTLVGCDQSSVFGDEGETMSPTYSCEYYEEVFNAWRVESYPNTPEEKRDGYCLIGIVFYYDPNAYGLSEEDKANGKVKCVSNLIYRYNDDDSDFQVVSVEFNQITDRVSFNEFKSRFPQDMMEYCRPSSFTLRYDWMDHENRVKACKIFYDVFLEENPDALEGLNIEPY